MKKLLMGNEAIAYGALKSGVRCVSGYPGTPSSEILETFLKMKKKDIYVEWSINEKVALEVAIGASMSGARALVTMKQVGMNVASDAFMNLSYLGVEGGLVVVVCDDPGPISSQTEQDTRVFAKFSKSPIFDPSSPEEAYRMIQDAFILSEEYKMPVILRPTTRVCHSYANLDIKEHLDCKKDYGFKRDKKRWVIFPKKSFENHILIEKRNKSLEKVFSEYPENRIRVKGKKGIIASGVVASYVEEYMQRNPDSDFSFLKISTPFPFPSNLAKKFLNKVDEIMILEEIDPVIEEEIIQILSEEKTKKMVYGKKNDFLKFAGEYSYDYTEEKILLFQGKNMSLEKKEVSSKLPQREPNLCPGCPHRTSFKVIKDATRDKKVIFNGDIGCYTLGNAKPLEIIDTCLCMGAGISISQGTDIFNKDAISFSFIGDSTFFASGIPGVINAVFNKRNVVIVILDNSTTAMTGYQTHPGLGKTASGEITEKISIRKILEAVGVEPLYLTDEISYKEKINLVKQEIYKDGVKAIIFKSPCVAIVKPQKAYYIDEKKCIKCNKCLSQVGCPAITKYEDKLEINENCVGCGLCREMCPVEAIKKED